MTKQQAIPAAIIGFGFVLVAWTAAGFGHLVLLALPVHAVLLAVIWWTLRRG